MNKQTPKKRTFLVLKRRRLLPIIIILATRVYYCAVLTHSLVVGVRSEDSVCVDERRLFARAAISSGGTKGREKWSDCTLTKRIGVVFYREILL